MQDIQWFTAGGGGGGGTSFWTANGDDIYNNNSGNVGIGTASPLAKLGVVGTIALNDGRSNAGVGNSAFNGVTTGEFNTALGVDAGRELTGGVHNTFIGYNANPVNGNNSYNTLLGSNARQSSNSNRMVAVGYAASVNGQGVTIGGQTGSTSGNSCITIGYSANVFGGSDNVTIGVTAGTAIVGNGNVSIGRFSNRYVTGSQNTALGDRAAVGVDGSAYSGITAIGSYSLFSITTGGQNTALGFESLRNLTIGSNNTALGYQALQQLTTRSNNTAVGGFALQHNIGANNTAVGYNAALGSIGASDFEETTAIGARALQSLTTGSSNTSLGYMSGSSLTEGSGNVLLGFMAGSNLTGERDLLYIANSDTNTPLIYGEFPNNLLRVNAPLNVFGETNVVGNTTIKGQFEVERSDSTTNLLTISSTSFDYRIANNSNNARVTIDRDGSTSSDYVALKVGSNITIKRNGGGTPTFSVGNAGFIYTQNYNGDTASNTNPFNNGAGMGIRNTNQGSNVILALQINGVFGALNSAGAKLQIGNPFAMNANWTQGHGTTFRNASNFIIEGTDTTAPESARWIFRYSNYTSGGNPPTDYRIGTGISGIPNLQLTSNQNARCTMTNGSDVVTITAGALRGWAQAGVMIYFRTTTGGSPLVVGPSTIGYEIVEVLSSTSFRISGNWTGDNIDVFAYLEAVSLTIRNWKKDILAKFLANGHFEVGTTNIGGSLNVTEAVSYEITDATHSAASEYLVGSTEFIVFNTWTGANGQAFIRLPLVANSEGRVLRFKSDGTISNSTYATITPNSADVGVTIDGSASFDLDRDYDGIMLLCHNSNWYVIQRKSK